MAINLKNLKNFKQGIKDTTPLQLSQSKLWGYAGMIFGLALACITTLLKYNWGFGIFLFFLTWLQLMFGIGEYKGYLGLKDMEELK